MTKEIKINTAQDAHAINNFATMKEYDVWVHGTSVMFDAKSLLGLLSLIGKKDSLKIVAPDNINPIKFANDLIKAGIV